MGADATAVPLVVGAASAAGWVLAGRAVWRLRRQLRTDRLTGLPNRDALMGEFARVTRRRRCGAVGVLLLDLDGFKQVNDTYGHAAGDAVLRHVADRLACATRPRGWLPVRLHGDEFAVLLPSLPLTAGFDMARQMCTWEVLRAIQTPLLWGEVEITPAASVGAAVAHVRHADLSALLRAADQRMYARKQRTQDGTAGGRCGEEGHGGHRALLQISRAHNPSARDTSTEGHRG
jgi:diguanylate cyclase (GGDEF)-like protein